MYYPEDRNMKRSRKRPFAIFLTIVVLAILGYLGYSFLTTGLTLEEKIEQNLVFESSVTASEKAKIKQSALENEISIDSQIVVTASVTEKYSHEELVQNTYVPITNFNSVMQKTTKADLVNTNVFADSELSDVEKSGLSSSLGIAIEKLGTIDLDNETVADDDVVFIPVNKLDADVKLLEFEGSYYLDSFDSGAIFRELIIVGEETSELLSVLDVNEILGSDKVFKANITGVTALTRVMMRKLDEVKDPLYFSAKIGDFLADADLTHVSNEVSFKPGCTYNNALFCSPPEFIETLKDSGVNLVELTGNHNNDFGSEFNTDSINMYHELGWDTVGGGLNNDDAAKPVNKDIKGSKVTFLAYNFPDSPNGGAISGADSAGANSFEFSRIESDIAAAKETSDFVVVNIQYWECYAYPEGYLEYPVCDKPIGEQEETFKKVVDLGADMVVGSSAHQPQTYEMYNGKPIYYGLGNLYFDQTSWPGTERGIILSNYFVGGELLQTKLTTTVYGTDLQTRVMTDEETEYLLTRLHDAR